jgi:hypothetical protein
MHGKIQVAAFRGVREGTHERPTARKLRGRIELDKSKRISVCLRVDRIPRVSMQAVSEGIFSQLRSLSRRSAKRSGSGRALYFEKNMRR